MPNGIMSKAVSSKQRRDQEDKCPGSQQRGFQKLPAKDRLGWNRQGEKKMCFAIAEKIRVTDHQVAEQEQDEEEGKQQKQQAFAQEDPQAGKSSEEFKPQPK